MFLFRGDLCIEGDTVFSNESRSLIQARTIYRDACSACFCVFTPLYVDLTCFQRAASMPYCAVSCRVHNLPPIYINHQPRCSHTLTLSFIGIMNLSLLSSATSTATSSLPKISLSLLQAQTHSLPPVPPYRCQTFLEAIFRDIEGASLTTSMMPYHLRRSQRSECNLLLRR